MPRARHVPKDDSYYADLELLWSLRLIEPVGNEFELTRIGTLFMQALRSEGS